MRIGRSIIVASLLPCFFWAVTATEVRHGTRGVASRQDGRKAYTAITLLNSIPGEGFVVEDKTNVNLEVALSNEQGIKGLTFQIKMPNSTTVALMPTTTETSTNQDLFKVTLNIADYFPILYGTWKWRVQAKDSTGAKTAFNWSTITFDQGCTPAKNGCGCKTVTPLPCSIIQDIRYAVAKKVWGLRVPGSTAEELKASSDAMKANPATFSIPAGDFIGGLVRLAFHDAAEYDPESSDMLRPDGCVDLNSPGNAGLASIIEEVDGLWEPFCNVMSRADFWVLAAKTAIEESTTYVPSEFGRNINEVGCDLATGQGCSHGERNLLRGDGFLDAFVLPFRYGRVDVKTCPAPAGRLPMSEAGAGEIEEKIMKKFNIDARHAVALMGAHTLGRCEIANSGYNSTWKDRPDIFTNTYYSLLLEGQWERVAMTDPRTGASLTQWNHITKSDRNAHAMMLAADMQMVYDIDPTLDQEFASSCGPLAMETEKVEIKRCPVTGKSWPNLNFDVYAREFAEGTTATHDEPGASRWLTAFASAFRSMTEIGYEEGDLLCPSCPSPACESCPQDVLCGVGHVHSPYGTTWPGTYPIYDYPVCSGKEDVCGQTTDMFTGNEEVDKALCQAAGGGNCLYVTPLV